MMMKSLFIPVGGFRCAKQQRAVLKVEAEEDSHLKKQ